MSKSLYAVLLTCMQFPLWVSVPANSMLPVSIGVPFHSDLPDERTIHLRKWDNESNDTTKVKHQQLFHGQHKNWKDHYQYKDKNKDFKVNEDVVKLIQFDFVPSATDQQLEKIAPIEKPWMDFQVDLAVPRSMIDTTKVRKPKKYIRMLPYSIWTRFGEDPVYDIFVFGYKKRLEMSWKLNMKDLEEYGRGMVPVAGQYNPNELMNSSVVVKDLDFIGFLYDNLNKQGRIRKRNRKHANAWKTYHKVAPYLDGHQSVVLDSIQNDAEDEAYPGLYHHLKTVELTEEKSPKYFERPDHTLLQTPELRSRFGTYYDPELYALPSDFEKDADSSRVDALHRNSPISEDKHAITSNGKSQVLIDQESKRYSNGQHEFKKEKQRRLRKPPHKRPHKQKKEDDVLEVLPNSMEDLYKYIRMKQQQDSLRRKELFRKDKVDQNVYELEQQQRVLKERQN